MPTPLAASSSLRWVSPRARYWVGLGGTDRHPQLFDKAGTLLVEQLSEPNGQLDMPFSPDLDGRYLLWGNPSGLVSVADLVEVRRRLTGVGLGW
jgi:hypothetical protein